MLQPCQFQLEEFMDLSASPARTATFRISVTKNDRLALNSAFHAHLNNAAAFRLRVSPDGYTLLLDTEGPFNLFPTDKGVQTRHDLGDLLRKNQISFPASYQAEWYEPWGCWMCQYEGLRKPPAGLKPTRTPGRKRKGA